MQTSCAFKSSGCINQSLELNKLNVLPQTRPDSYPLIRSACQSGFESASFPPQTFAHEAIFPVVVATSTFFPAELDHLDSTPSI